MTVVKMVACSTYRASELARLMVHLGRADVSSSTVHLTGAEDCGKTTLARQLVASVDDAVHAHYVDCQHAFGDERTLYAHILDVIGCREDDKVVYVQQFVNAVIRVVDALDGPLLLVLDNVHAVRRLPDHVFVALANLPLITNHRVRLLTVSNLAYRKFHIWFRPLALSPVQVVLPGNTRDEVISLLTADVDSPTYRSVIKHVVTVMFVMHCRSLTALASIAEHVHARLIATLDRERRALHLTLNNDASTADVLMEEEGITADNVDDYKMPAKELWEKLGPLIKAETVGMYAFGEANDTLPTLTRLLLVAAYCCSYNPHKFDTRLLVKARTTSGRAPRAHYAGVESKESLHNRGAAIVPLNRLTHAFRALAHAHMGAEEGVWSEVTPRMLANINVLTQLSTLVSHGHLAQTSAMGNLNEPKFRCLVDLDTIRAMAMRIDIHVDIYLIDFAGK